MSPTPVSRRDRDEGYVSPQIRRSDKTAGAASIQAVLDGYRDRSILRYFSNPAVMSLFAKGLTDFEGLSENEKRQFLYLLAESVTQMQQTMEPHRRSAEGRSMALRWARQLPRA